MMDAYYSSTDEDEVAHGDLVGPEGIVTIVVRKYSMPLASLFGDTSPIKFVPLSDIEDDFDLAIYIPEYLLSSIPTAILQQGLESLIYVAGVTFLDSGPDAVSRLG